MSHPDASNDYSGMKAAIDIVFLLDATASMQPCIDAVHANIHHIVSALTNPAHIYWGSAGMPVDWRASVCAYRDFTYEPKFGKQPLIINPFTRSIGELEQQMNGIRAEGGGDEPESLLDALYMVLTRGEAKPGEPAQNNLWRAKHAALRCIIAFTDASYHPTMEVLPGGTLADVQQLLLKERVCLHLIAPAMACHFELAESDRCEYDLVDIPEGSTAAKALRDFAANPSHFASFIRRVTIPRS